MSLASNYLFQKLRAGGASLSDLADRVYLRGALLDEEGVAAHSQATADAIVGRALAELRKAPAASTSSRRASRPSRRAGSSSVTAASIRREADRWRTRASVEDDEDEEDGVDDESDTTRREADDDEWKPDPSESLEEMHRRFLEYVRKPKRTTPAPDPDLGGKNGRELTDEIPQTVGGPKPLPQKAPDGPGKGLKAVVHGPGHFSISFPTSPPSKEDRAKLDAKIARLAAADPRIASALARAGIR